ncbi:S8 family peptidase [Aequorivita sinensis]|uniref:S8 family peptidase n=1 Tax=Aequorivita sinensis TaxID=1382458 RepID=UPI00111D993C|nr:S8/S53 family peptidase [Aequorivita sinensis]
MKHYLIVIFCLIISIPSTAQSDSWFYLTARDSTVEVPFVKEGNYLKYSGNNSRLKSVLKNYKISEFKKTYRKAKKEDLNATFFVIADNSFLLEDLLQTSGGLFKRGEIIPDEQKKIFEPNDYGLTSTIGGNEGFAVNLDYLDFLGLPEAWYYTTGDSKTVIGISDGAIDTTNIDLKDKTTIFHKSPDVDGHGTSVAAIAAAQGDNGYGIPGVCYDCAIYGTTYGRFRTFEILQELSKAGAKVINCSWVGSYNTPEVQDEVNEMFARGTILVAAAGNRGWERNKGEMSYFPASYDNVISVSSVNYKYENIEDNILKSDNNKFYIENIRGYVGRTGGFKNNDITQAVSTYPVSVTTLNKDVDILAPSNGQLRFTHSIKEGKPVYITIEATSPAAPLVSGTIGLMFSLYPCLPVTEVESILKMTSTNIDHIEANKPFAGKYGAGMLHTGRAVKMVFDMFAEKGPVTIENQSFNRWDFKLTSHAEVILQNQTFKEDASLNLTSKKGITIGKNTVLKPNAKGKIHLKIDPTLQKECELQLRDPSILKD